MYVDRGVDRELAEQVARQLSHDPDQALVIHAQDSDLAGNEIDATLAVFILRHEIERSSIASLIPHVSNDQEAWLVIFHFLAGDLSV